MRGYQAMCGCLLAAALAPGAPAPKVPKPHPLVGTWLILTSTQDGNTVEIKGDHCRTFTADGRRMGHTLQTQPTGSNKYAIDEKARPPAFTVTFEYATAPPGGPSPSCSRSTATA